MSVQITLESLLSYSDHERRKWHGWINADSSRLRIPFQPGQRFPDVASLFDHIFLVERRHLSRLEGGTPPVSTGVTPGDAEALFEYADLVRADFRNYLDGMDATEAGSTLLITGLQSSGDISMTKRRLATHILLHELRHLAQIAYAARLAGHAPPGQHDLFYFGDFT
ncbi:MAG TPA: DinB family protein [Vicinamibacterales bacterium]|jgi:uncharacterized damage-inducible protein DinB|nr:DinB family protein [Vicinamibacterales bacterium]